MPHLLPCSLPQPHLQYDEQSVEAWYFYQLSVLVLTIHQPDITIHTIPALMKYNCGYFSCMNNYPKTIESGTGEQLTFVRRYVKDGNEYLEAENLVQPGSGPPMHVHHLQDESLTVLEGVLAAQVLGEEPKYFYPGETAYFARGVAHKFWNAGNTPLRCTGFVTPVYNLEYFLTEIYRSTREGGKGRPATFDAAFLLDRYKSEFDMFDIPSFVKKVIFPVTILTGKLKGLHRKFKNAPQPVMK